MNAEIVCVGTELALGEILNTNSAWLARELAEIGIETLHHSTVGDGRKEMADAISHAAGRTDFVIVTGGIGPTPDDITRQVVAEVAGVELVRDEPSLAHIRGLFAGWGREMAQSNAIQADFPAGSRIIPNPNGTAAGFHMPLGRAHIFVLPGVPAEMRAMWKDTVRPYLCGKTSGVVITRTVNCYGRGESEITDIIRDLMEPGRNPLVGDTAEDSIIKIRLRATAGTIEEALSLVAGTKAEIAGRLPDVVFGEDDDTLESAVVKLLRARGLTVAVAESCTGGLVAKRLTDIAGSSAVFIQGVVAYSNDAKTRLLGVPAKLIEKHGAVSAEVARSMAQGVRDSAGADFGLGVTGIAGPEGGTPEKPVGLVYVAIASESGVESRELHLRGDRERVRDRTTKTILNILRLAIGNIE